MRVRWVFLAVLAGSLACGGGDEQPVPPIPDRPEASAPAVPAVTPVAVVAAVAPAEPVAGSAASARSFTFDENHEISREQIVAAYRDSCRAVIPSRATEYAEGSAGDVANECLFVEFAQNCSPDLHGCFDVLMTCQTECGAPCDACEQQCAPSCESCVSSCHGDVDCLARCANDRADCRDACMSGRQACFSECLTKMMLCESEGEAKMQENCGDCAAFKACLEQPAETTEYEALRARCLDQLPVPSCGEWCAWH